MATKHKSSSQKPPIIDLGPWNFIIFVTLGLILVVVVMQFTTTQVRELRARAGYDCPSITKLPRPEDCPGGEWRFTRNTQGCQTFICNTVELKEGSFQAPSRPTRNPRVPTQ